MKIAYSWLKKFVEIKLPAQKLAAGLTMAGLEVVGLEKQAGDFVFEIEITSNRPDWLSVLGVAREVSAIYGAKLKKPGLVAPKREIAAGAAFSISVTDPKDCPFYSGRVITGVQVGPSPEWLQKDLAALGCRSVNNVVDITNYCLFAFGQPLHAFDLDKLRQGRIKVRRAQAGEQLITIDGQTRALDPGMLVIADAQRPVAVAGIMGGLDTEVTPATRNILLESAVFNPILIRRAKQKLGLQSESAYRFERGVDLEAVSSTAREAQRMILSLAGGKPAGVKNVGTDRAAKRKISLDMEYLNRLLGTQLSSPKVKAILKSLGLWVSAKGENLLSVGIPCFRQDLKQPVDLVEEVARIYGYDKIPQTLPAVRPAVNCPGQWEAEHLIKAALQGLGLNEVITYSLIDQNLLEQAGINADTGAVYIANPLSKEQEILRPFLWPSLARAVAYNLNQQQEPISIFEIASGFQGQGSGVKEEPLLGIALSGAKSWLTKNGLLQDEFNLLYLKGIFEAVFAVLGIKAFEFIQKDNNAVDILVDQQPAGFMLDLSPAVLQKFDIKNHQVVVAQISLEKLWASSGEKKRFQEIPKFPAVTRDISFVASQDIAVKDILEAVQSQGRPLLQQASIVDYYQGKQIPAGFQGLTLSCRYRQDNRTLTEEEVAPVHNGICSLLTEKFQVKLR